MHRFLVEYPETEPYSVYRLMTQLRAPSISFCSGTFISSNVYATALHCIERARQPVSLFEESPFNFKESNFFSHLIGRVELLDSNDNPVASSSLAVIENNSRDLAYIIFPKGTSKSWVETPSNLDIQTELNRLKKIGWKDQNTSGEFFGFGQTLRYEGSSNNLDLSNSSNQVQKGMVSRAFYNENDNTIVVTASVDPKSLDTANNQCPLWGDSGGPLFLNGKLMATARNVYFHPTNILPLIRPEQPRLKRGDIIEYQGNSGQLEIWTMNSMMGCAFSVINPPEVIRSLLVY